MSKPKYTPGPWGARLAESTYKYWVIEERQYNGFQIASTINDEVEQGEANARLIAAAPELLAAVKSMLLFIETYGGEVTAGFSGPDNANLEFYKRLIAKAEGNSNE